MKSFKNILKRKDRFDVSRFFTKMLSTGVVVLMPPRRWYWTAFRLSWLSRMRSRHTPGNYLSKGIVRAQMMNTMLAMFTRTGQLFHIPYRVTGIENLQHPAQGLVLCTVHLPMSKVASRALVENKFEIDGVIVAKPNPDQKMPIWGIETRIPELPKDAYVLVKAKNILVQNGCVLLMVDTGLKSEISTNSFRICGKTRARLAFFFAQLAPDGIVDVSCELAPHPACENDTAIQANLEFLKRRTNAILTDYKSGSALKSQFNTQTADNT